MKFSCICPIYYKSNLFEVKRSVKSILKQSLLPNELLIVFDGPVNKKIISFLYKLKKNNLRIIRFEKNSGLGPTLKKAIKLSKYEIIIRADSDDINKKDRFKTLINFFKKNTKYDVVGSYIQEIDNFKKYIKKVPTNHEEIVKKLIYRNTINHPSVAFKKKIVLKFGSYQNVPYFEDYYLWFKLSFNKVKFYNINKVLVTTYRDQNFLKRRSGYLYFKFYLLFLKKIYLKRYINKKEFINNLLIRFLILNMPIFFLKFFYRYINKRTMNNEK